MKAVHNSEGKFLSGIHAISEFFFTTETPQVARKSYLLFTPIKGLRFAQASIKFRQVILL